MTMVARMYQIPKNPSHNLPNFSNPPKLRISPNPKPDSKKLEIW
jgi:hypothetical protein